MINLLELNRQELGELARSRFGTLTAKDVPADWRDQLEKDRKILSGRVCFICRRKGRCLHREMESSG